MNITVTEAIDLLTECLQEYGDVPISMLDMRDPHDHSRFMRGYHYKHAASGEHTHSIPKEYYKRDE